MFKGYDDWKLADGLSDKERNLKTFKARIYIDKDIEIEAESKDDVEDILTDDLESYVNTSDIEWDIY